MYLNFLFCCIKFVFIWPSKASKFKSLYLVANRNKVGFLSNNSNKCNQRIHSRRWNIAGTVDVQLVVQYCSVSSQAKLTNCDLKGQHCQDGLSLSINQKFNPTSNILASSSGSSDHIDSMVSSDIKLVLWRSSPYRVALWLRTGYAWPGLSSFPESNPPARSAAWTLALQGRQEGTIELVTFS